jgi:uncharacterized cupin superfamily protein
MARVAPAKIDVVGTQFEGRLDVGQAVDSKATAMYVYDVAPGRSASPYHYENEEEWLLVLDGCRTRTAKKAGRATSKLAACLSS